MKPAWMLGLLPVVLAVAVAGVFLAMPAQPAHPALSQAEIEGIARELVAEVGPVQGQAFLQLVTTPEAAPGSAAVDQAPGAAGADDVVLTAADVGPNFILAASGVKIQGGVSLRTNLIVRADRFSSYVEPDGMLGVRSFAIVAPDPFSADQAFDQIAGDLFRGTQEVPIPAVGDRSKGAIEWGDTPFESSGRAILFRTRNTVGGVMTGSFEAPMNMDEIVPLARIMAARAGR